MRELKFSYILEHYQTKKRREVIFNYNEVLIGAARNTLNYLDFERVVANREFTGVTNQDNKDLYQGDIVIGSSMMEDDVIGVIEFHSGQFMHSKSDFGYEGEYLINLYRCKKLGNKHQNPELLETKKEEA